MHFPIVTINTKFLNSLQPEWLKYVTQVRLAKRLTVDTFDDLFDYLQQFEKLVNVSRAKKLEKSHDPLALDECSQQISEDPLTSAMLNQSIIQGDRVIIQSRNSDNAGRNNRRAYVQEEINDFFFADASRMEEIKELSANICLMAIIQPADNNSDAGPSYDSAFNK
ncbi:hypothetical protein Tco_0481843 [Tanacetum coccineum]